MNPIPMIATDGAHAFAALLMRQRLRFVARCSEFWMDEFQARVAR